MNIKKLFSGLIASTLLISSIPSSLVLASANPDESKEKEISSNLAITTDGMDEIEGARTAFTKTFKDNQGQLYKEIYAEPVHAKTKGTYEEIDNTVSSDPSDKDILATENTSLVAEFPKNLQQDTGFTFKKGPHQVEFELTGASKQGQKIKPNLLSKTSLENNKVQYNDVYPDVDLRHITFNEEVKEDWIIKKYTGINQFSYTLRTKLKPMLQQDGSIDFLEKTGDAEAVFTLPAPEMMDSNINEGKGEGTYSKQLRYLLEENTNGTYNLVLDIDKEWLASSDRKYPIYVDPSVSIDALGDAYISSKAPTTNFNEKWDPVQGEYVLQTGYYDSTSGTNYAFIKFSVANELKGAVIDSASLQAYVTHAYYATQKNGLWVDEANSKWAINEVNWNNKPSSTKISSTLVGRDEWAKLDVKSTLQAWVSEERPNTGFKLHTNGNGQTYWKKITASESANKPKLVIAYHYDQMPTPTMSAQLDNATAKTGSVNVNWKSVFGASSYKLQMFDGYRYETVYTGSALNWTSKDKKIFPKAPFSSSSRYKLDGTGTELPIDPSAFYSANLGSSTTTKTYKFRIVPVYPTGDGPTSTIISKEIPVPAGEPDLPTVTTGTYSEADTINKGRGWLNVKWNKVANATGYKVRIWNGSVYKNYTVGKDTTSISTKGKKIWPTDVQIKAGVTDLYDVNFDDTVSIAKGAELPIDPSATYGNSSSRYSVRVIATSAAGDSPSSDVNYGYMKLYAPKNLSITANDDNLVQNKASLTMKWSPSVGANYYEIQLNNGTAIEKYKVKGTTSFTTPKATYELGKPYTANVVAFFEDDDTAYESEEGKVSGQRGVSNLSGTAKNSINLHEELIGVEDFYSYDETEFGNATSYVNVTTGNMALQFTDESLISKSKLDYDFTRTYNSRSIKLSPLGLGWTFVGNESLEEVTGDDVHYSDEDGTIHTFKNINGKLISPKGTYQELQKENNRYKLKTKEGLIKYFEEDQLLKKYVLSSYEDELQNKLSFIRNEKKQLIEVYETRESSNVPEDKIKIEYENDRVSQVRHGDHWTKFYYLNDLLVKTVIGSEKTTRTIIEEFQYDANKELQKYIDPKKNETIFEYNINKLIFSSKPKDEINPLVMNSYNFDSLHNEFTVTDESDNETTYKRDIDGNNYVVIEKVSPGEENDEKTLFQYDDQYNVLKKTSSNGINETKSYDGKGNVLNITTSEGTISNVYDENNNIIKSTDINGEVVNNVYIDSLLTKSKINDEETNYSYDVFGRLTKVEYPDGTNEITEYDDTKNKVSLTDNQQSTTSVIYSTYGEMLKEIDAENHENSYEYDPLHPHLIISVKNKMGQKTSYQYDENKNLKVVTDALGRSKTYTYDKNDHLILVKMPIVEINYEYGINGDIEKILWPSKKQTSYSYTVDGQIEYVNNGKDLFKYTYNENGNIIKVSKNDLLLKNYLYSEQENLLQTYSFDTFSQNYNYDDVERIKEVNSSMGKEFAVSQINSFKDESDDLNQVRYTTDNVLHDYKIDTNSLNVSSTVTLNEDLLKLETESYGLNLIKSLNYTSKKQKPLYIEYQYTKSGNISKEDMNGKITSFEYDLNDQLIKEVLHDRTNFYTYDAVGNRLSANLGNKENNYVYNSLNQITKKNGVSYLYDLDGNLIKDEKYQYNYDEQQNLIKIQSLDGKLSAEYTYDEEGQRISKVVGNKTHQYFYNDNLLSIEVIKVGNDISQYRFYEWNESTPLGMITKTKTDTGTFSTNSYQFLTNYRGDVLSIRDELDNEVGSYQYDAYGNILSIQGKIAEESPIRYAGYYFDDESQNYYLLAHYYNPENGVFLAIDPEAGSIDSPESQNQYNYTDNDPVNHIDADGENKLRMAFTAGKWLAKKVGSGIKWAWKKVAKSPNKIAKPIAALTEKKIEHIMAKKHDWDKVVKNDNDWKKIAKIMSKVLSKGKEGPYKGSKDVKKRTLKVGKHKVSVIFVRIDGKIVVSNGWVNSK